MTKLKLSHSKISVFLDCRQKFQYQYIERLTPKIEKAMPLQVGDIIHQLLHNLDTGNLDLDNLDLQAFVRESYPTSSDEVISSVALECGRLIRGYINKWRSGPDTLNFISSEVHFEHEEPDFILYTRVDGLARTEDHRLWRVERKTAAKTDNAFLSGLRKGRQTSIAHHILLNVLKEPISGSIFDLLVKTKEPQYYRNPFMLNRRSIEMCLETIQGVVRSINHGDFYRSCECFSYNRECDYITLCQNDTQHVRETFFSVREDK